ncbi:MAG: sialate O-acetylesterase [Prevotella sp.]|nr:sialate O-acetylesterase [Prevotella sp.]
MKRLVMILMACVFALGAEAKVTPSRLFQDGMVLQRGRAIPVWGTADRGERFTVAFGGKSYAVEADGRGQWRVELPKMKAGGPYTMTIADRTINDVLVGDVWLCSGQSNMDVTIERVSPQYPELVKTYSNDRVRLLRVDQVARVGGPQSDFRTSGWKHLNPTDSWKFSAIGYFLGKRLQEETGVPQGIICNSWGGTPIEAWIPEDSLKRDFPQYLNRLALYTPEYVEAQTRANNEMNNRWQQVLNEADPGMKEGWTGLDYNDGAWKSYSQYARDWAQSDGRGVVGSVWMRQHVRIDAAHAGKPALLVLGTLYDADYTYVNGRQVGVTYYQYPPRRYEIPAGLLHEGDNVIAIRFVNKTGTPAFTKGKKYELQFAANDILPLSEQWLGHIGAEMPACPQQDVNVQYLPTVMHNSMTAPIVPYALAGVVWYQGESNTGKSEEYLPMLRKLKGSWRTLLGDAQLPVVVVQLANFMAPSAQPQESDWAALREAQRLSTVEDARSELAVAIDMGEANDIHPLRKKEVADRVALAMERLYYGRKVVLSPAPQRARVENNIVVVDFDQNLRAGEVFELELKGDDGHYHQVSATAKGRRVVIGMGQVAHPTMVRYAWKDNPDKANVYNLKGLPATPFQISIDQ